MTPEVFREFIGSSIEDSGLLLASIDSQNDDTIAEVDVAALGAGSGGKFFLVPSTALHPWRYSPGMIVIDSPCLAMNSRSKICLTPAYIAFRTSTDDLDLIGNSKTWISALKRRLKGQAVGHVIGFREDCPSKRSIYRNISVSKDANLFWENGGLLVQDIYEEDRPVVYEPCLGVDYLSN